MPYLSLSNELPERIEPRQPEICEDTPETHENREVTVSRPSNAPQARVLREDPPETRENREVTVSRPSNASRARVPREDSPETRERARAKKAKETYGGLEQAYNNYAIHGSPTLDE